MDTSSEGRTPGLVPWNGELYAANTDHHRRYDEEFLTTFALQPTDRVLDVGCGSGDFTAKVAALVPAGHVVGLEPQPSMIVEAERRALPNQSFVRAPAQALARAVSDVVEPFDVVMSRSVLHWVPAAEHRSILEQCRQVLRPGGVLRIECGGGDNTRDVVAFLDGLARSVAGARAVRAPWTFLHAGEYLDRLLDVGFDVDAGFVRTVAQRRPFDRESVLGWLHSQVIQAYEVGLDPDERARLRAAVDEHIDELRRPDGTYDVTFVRLDLRANAPARPLRR
jgi:trans-aconitate methyltransferase